MASLFKQLLFEKKKSSTGSRRNSEIVTSNIHELNSHSSLKNDIITITSSNSSTPSSTVRDRRHSLPETGVNALDFTNNQFLDTILEV